MTHKISRNLTLFLLVFSIGLSPILAFAKSENGKGNGKANNQKIEQISKKKEEKEERKKEKREDKREEIKKENEERKEEKKEERKSEEKSKNLVQKTNESCTKAFGHLIAPGYIKNKGEVSYFFSNCFLPFGIAKKFGGSYSSTTDTTAPVISNIKTNPQTNEAVITWTTNEKADSTVFWSFSSGVNTSSSTNVSKSKLTKDHRIVVSGLNASTTYFAVIRSKDASGNSSLSSEISFTTKPTQLDTVSPVISDVALLNSTSSINVSWKTDENSTSRLYYGTFANLNVNSSSTAFVESTTLVKNHLVALTGLTASTTYYLAVESKDASGNRTVTPVFTTHTTGSTVLDTTAPVISNIVTTSGTSTVGVTWNTNEPTTSKLFYSTTSPLITSASSTNFISSGTLLINHNMTVTNLATSTLYYFLIQSTDSSSNISISTQFQTTTTSGL